MEESNNITLQKEVTAETEETKKNKKKNTRQNNN